jgi:hypothetical protein
MASIEGGATPFYVEASGASVTIQGLRFIRPTGDAIFVYAVSGLVIASCKIEGTIGGDGIDIITSVGIPNPTNPGKPENISGTLLVVNNDIDVGGTALDQQVGVLIFSVGVPGAEVEAYVSGNKIKQHHRARDQFPPCRRASVYRAEHDQHGLCNARGGPCDSRRKFRFVSDCA